MGTRSIVVSAAAWLLLVFLCGCSKALITAPVAASNGRWEIVLKDLRLGPDQYGTANGHWEPKKGRRFLRASVRITNGLRTDQEFLLGKIILTAGGRKVRPFILDMGGPVSLRANPAPRCAPGETISRKIIYIVPEGAPPERITYERTEIRIPAAAREARRGI